MERRRKNPLICSLWQGKLFPYVLHNKKKKTNKTCHSWMEEKWYWHLFSVNKYTIAVKVRLFDWHQCQRRSTACCFLYKCQLCRKTPKLLCWSENCVQQKPPWSWQLFFCWLPWRLTAALVSMASISFCFQPGKQLNMKHYFSSATILKPGVLTDFVFLGSELLWADSCSDGFLV